MNKLAKGTIMALAVACVINWGYFSRILDLESRAISEVFEGQETSVDELQEELTSLTAWKLVNPDVLSLLPEGYEEVIPNSLDDLKQLNETFSELVNG